MVSVSSFSPSYLKSNFFVEFSVIFFLYVSEFSPQFADIAFCTLHKHFKFSADDGCHTLDAFPRSHKSVHFFPGLKRVAWPPPPQDDDYKVVKQPQFPPSFHHQVSFQLFHTWVSRRTWRNEIYKRAPLMYTRISMQVAYRHLLRCSAWKDFGFPEANNRRVALLTTYLHLLDMHAYIVQQPNKRVNFQY